MLNGYLKIYRSLSEHWIWENPDELKAWLCILMNARYKAKKITVAGKAHIIKPGQAVRTKNEWADLFGWEGTKEGVRKKVERFFSKLVTDNMIVQTKLGKYTKITVCNYQKYNVVGSDCPDNCPDDVRIFEQSKDYVSDSYNENKNKNVRILSGNSSGSCPEMSGFSEAQKPKNQEVSTDKLADGVRVVTKEYSIYKGDKSFLKKLLNKKPTYLYNKIRFWSEVTGLGHDQIFEVMEKWAEGVELAAFNDDLHIINSFGKYVVNYHDKNKSNERPKPLSINRNNSKKSKTELFKQLHGE